jgi:hypothetical protein
MTKYAIVRAMHQIWNFIAIAARFPENERSISFGFELDYSLLRKTIVFVSSIVIGSMV